MATAALNKTVYNAPYGMDLTASRTYLHGLLSFGGGNYVAGGLLPNWNPTTGILAPLADVSGQNVLVGRIPTTQPVLAFITSFTVSGTTCVFSTVNPPPVGHTVALSGFSLSTSIPLNGVSAKITAISAGVSFTCTITTTATSSSDTGLAVDLPAQTMLITGASISSTTCVFNTPAPPVVGQYVTLGGFTASTLVPFNGITAQVTAIVANTSFTCTITTTATTATGAGYANLVIGPDTMWISTIAGSGYQYSYNKANGTVQIFTGAAAQSPLAELTAGALIAGMLTDGIEFEEEYVRL